VIIKTSLRLISTVHSVDILINFSLCTVKLVHKKSKPIWVKPKAKRLDGKRASEWGRRNHEPAETQIQLQIRNEIENAYMCVHVCVGKGGGAGKANLAAN